VERIVEIIKDGSEHISRKLKVLSLQRKISKLQKDRSKTISAIGACAWDECPEHVRQIDPSLFELHQEKDNIVAETESKIEEVRKRLNSRQQLHEQDEHLNFELTDGLELLLGKRSSLRAEKKRIEADIRINEQKSESVSEADKEEESSKKLKDLQEKLLQITKEQEKAQEEIETIHDEISGFRKKQQRFIEDIGKGEKEEKRIRREAKKKTEPLLREIEKRNSELGEILVENRPDCKSLDDKFSSYDLIKTTLDAAESSLTSENALLELLDRRNTMLFYSVGAALLLIVAGVLWLLIWIFFF
jgi:chromosome segregation ATPase